VEKIGIDRGIYWVLSTCAVITNNKEQYGRFSISSRKALLWAGLWAYSILNEWHESFTDVANYTSNISINSWQLNSVSDRLGTNVRFRGFTVGLLARSQFGLANSIKVFRGFLGPRANAELVPKFHVTLHISHADFPMGTLKISSCTNVTLTYDFDIGVDYPVHGGYGWRSPTPRRRSNCQTKKLKSVPGTKTK
jgi:hypothetical protein